MTMRAVLVLFSALLSSAAGHPDGPSPPQAELRGITDLYLDVTVRAYAADQIGGRIDSAAESRLRAKLRDVLQGAGMPVDRRIGAGVPELRVSVRIGRAPSHPGVAAVHTTVAFSDVVRLPRLPEATPSEQGVLWDTAAISLVDDREIESTATKAAAAGVDAFLHAVRSAEAVPR
jgi:hypothetical protein